MNAPLQSALHTLLERLLHYRGDIVPPDEGSTEHPLHLAVRDVETVMCPNAERKRLPLRGYRHWVMLLRCCRGSHARTYDDGCQQPAIPPDQWSAIRAAGRLEEWVREQLEDLNDYSHNRVALPLSVDEYLLKCGISSAGPLTRAIADAARYYEWRSCPWVALSRQQCDQLIKELGREHQFVYSGDVLFGHVLGAVMDDEREILEHERHFGKCITI